MNLRAVFLGTCGALLAMSSVARADLTGTTLTDNNGTGFGNVTSLLGLQNNDQGATQETGGVTWNGSAFVATTSDVKQCCTGPASQLASIGSLNWVSGANVGIVLNFNTVPNSGNITLSDLTLTLFDPATHLAVANFLLDTDYTFTQNDIEQGSGSAGWLFTLTAAQAAQFTGFAGNQNLLAGITLATLSNPTDGIDNFYALNVAPVPGPLAGAGLPGLIVACGGLLALARRRRQQAA